MPAVMALTVLPFISILPHLLPITKHSYFELSAVLSTKRNCRAAALPPMRFISDTTGAGLMVCAPFSYFIVMICASSSTCTSQ